MHNATIHGEQDGPISLHVSTSENRLRLSLVNNAGNNHAHCLSIQAAYGRDALLSAAISKQDMEQIGAAQSTFLGCKEMQTAAAAAGDTTVSLLFQAGTVELVVDTSLVVGEPPLDEDDALELRNAVLVCADDDKVPRTQYKGLSKKLNVKESHILGEKFEEVAGLAQTVTQLAAKHGSENMVCIFDQNMDKYEGQKVLGTDVVRQLRSTGFKGVIFIRSANDDAASEAKYIRAGANGCLGKGEPMPVLKVQIVKQCRMVWALGV